MDPVFAAQLRDRYGIVFVFPPGWQPPAPGRLHVLDETFTAELQRLIEEAVQAQQS